MFLWFFFNNAKFHERTVSRSADIKNVCTGGKGCVHSPFLPFMDAGNTYVGNKVSYTFELLKWVGIFRGWVGGVGVIHQGGVWWVGVFRGGIFLVGTNFILSSWSRNMIGWFMKTYLPIKTLQFPSRGKI